MTLKSGLLTAAVAGAGLLTLKQLRRLSRIDLRGKVVLITGGSRGLGLATAREFGRQGASLVLCARDEQELDRAREDLLGRGMACVTLVCDITDSGQVVKMVADATEQMGAIDVLVNNAGVIKVGPFADMDTRDFDEAMKVIFWGALYTTLAVLPAMRQRGGGSIVNITSVGGKVSVPHLLPYSCAKFAAVALSEGLRSELAPTGIKVTTIVPGLMRTGSHLNARFKGDRAAEYGWFAAGAATPIVSIGVERAARSIVDAVVHGDAERILSLPADLLSRLHGLLPEFTSGLLELANLALPSSRNVPGARESSGAEVEAKFNSRLWKAATGAGQKAAEQFNEIAGNSGNGVAQW